MTPRLVPSTVAAGVLAVIVTWLAGLLWFASTIPADTRAAFNQAGEWVVQLYQAWNKPDRVLEWASKLERTRGSQNK